MSDLYHGEHPVDMTPAEARHTLAEQQRLNDRIEAEAARVAKVSSDTGAGLVRTISRAIHEHLSRRDIMQYLDNEEDCEGLARSVVAALGMSATPTDATDGATSGGEVRTTYDFDMAYNGGYWAGVHATTPGGDLLEQAAKECRNIADNSRLVLDGHDARVRHEGIVAGAQACERAVLALKPAGDGGEA
jgi:hypothetical protein